MKALLMLFEDNENMILDDMLHYLESKQNIELLEAVSKTNSLHYGDLKIEPQYRLVKVGGETHELTNYEFEVLYLLARYPGRVFSKEQIYSYVWKTPFYGAENNVMSLIRRIRKKIEPDPAKPIYILTVWGSGYKFNDMMK